MVAIQHQAPTTAAEPNLELLILMPKMAGTLQHALKRRLYTTWDRKLRVATDLAAGLAAVRLCPVCLP